MMFKKIAIVAGLALALAATAEAKDAALQERLAD